MTPFRSRAKLTAHARLHALDAAEGWRWLVEPGHRGTWDSLVARTAGCRRREHGDGSCSRFAECEEAGELAAEPYFALADAELGFSLRHPRWVTRGRNHWQFGEWTDDPPWEWAGVGPLGIYFAVSDDERFLKTALRHNGVAPPRPTGASAASLQEDRVRRIVGGLGKQYARIATGGTGPSGQDLGRVRRHLEAAVAAGRVTGSGPIADYAAVLYSGDEPVRSLVLTAETP